MISLFHSKEFLGVTLNRYGTVIDKGGRQASLELTGWVQDEARKNGWSLVDSHDRDIGQVWMPPKQPPNARF